MGNFFPLPLFLLFLKFHMVAYSFDNSGQRMSFPHWHSNQTNIDRTNAIIKTIISMFKDQSQTVPIIAPLNESVDNVRLLSHMISLKTFFFPTDLQVLMVPRF